MKQQIQRVTLEGEITEVAFDNLCGKYLIKNFSDEPIYVSFDEEFTEANSTKIAAGFYQVVIANEWLGGLDVYKTKSIYINGTGEVEVQQLCFH